MHVSNFCLLWKVLISLSIMKAIFAGYGNLGWQLPLWLDQRSLLPLTQLFPYLFWILCSLYHVVYRPCLPTPVGELMVYWWNQIYYATSIDFLSSSSGTLAWEGMSVRWDGRWCHTATIISLKSPGARSLSCIISICSQNFYQYSKGIWWNLSAFVYLKKWLIF
jgi:hypothetical protein